MALVEVVKYDGSPDVFAWKFPNIELGTWTQLIVNESQEAVLFKGGKALDIFGSGRHTLETANIPLLNKIINLPFGGRSPFTAEIWYINKVYSLDIKWGTTVPIQLQDPKYGVFIPIRSFGQFGIKIEDSKKFLIKLVGTMSVFDKENIVKYFRGLYLTKVKDSISSYLINKKISIMEINAYLDELSSYMGDRIKTTLDEYGISLVNFYVNSISVPEDDSAVIKLKEALAKRAEMDIIGYNYQQQRSFDTMEGAAKNPGTGSSGLMGAGIGLGMGIPIGGALGNEFKGVTKNLGTQDEEKKCPRCSASMGKDKRFCTDCGFDTNSKDNSFKTIKCNKCNAVLDPNKKFCPNCGDRYNPCPNCKNDISEGSGTCHVCGYKMPISCPGCGKKIDAGTKFCPECGIKVTKKCMKCNTEDIESNNKFCPHCGEKL